MTKLDKELLSGDNNITFNNLFLENAAGADCIIKCFIWDISSGIKPVSAAIEKMLD